MLIGNVILQPIISDIFNLFIFLALSEYFHTHTLILLAQMSHFVAVTHCACLLWSNSMILATNHSDCYLLVQHQYLVPALCNFVFSV